MTRLQTLRSLLEPVVLFLNRPVECKELTGGTHILYYGTVLRCKVVYHSVRHGYQGLFLRFPPVTEPKTLGDFLPSGTTPEAEDYRGSVVEFYTQMRNVRNYFHGIFFLPYEYDTDWLDMDDLTREVDRVFENRSSVALRKSELERLERQRQKCGLKGKTMWRGEGSRKEDQIMEVERNLELGSRNAAWNSGRSFSIVLH